MKKYLYLLIIIIISCHKPYESVSVHLKVSQVPQLENWGFHAKELIKLWSPRISRILDIEDYPHNIDLTIQKSDEGIAFADSNAITVSSHWIEKYPEDIGLIVHEAVHVVQLCPEFEPGWITEGIADYIREPVKVRRREYRARRIVRKIQYDQPCLWADRILQPIPVNLEIGILSGR